MTSFSRSIAFLLVALGAAVLGNAVHLPGGAIRQGFGATAHHDVYVIDPPPLIPRQPVVLSPRRRRE